MALDPTINFGKVTVSTGYNAAATSIVLASGQGSELPSTFSYNLVWWDSTSYPDPADDPNVEIVRCTARSTDTLTVTRAQEGTAATIKNTSGKTYKIILAVTSKMIDDIKKTLELEDTTSSTTGVVLKNSLPFIHNFHHPTGDSAIPDGSNTFLGINAGNFTMGAAATFGAEGSYNTGVGEDALSSNTDGYDNTAIGSQALKNNTIGTGNTALGTWALYGATTPHGNTAIGDLSMGWNGQLITGKWNTGCGAITLGSLTTGQGNTGLGNDALFTLLSGDYNTAIGAESLYYLITGSYNVAIGENAGAYITGGATPNETSGTSIYIGRDTRALADGGANEIVIGDSVTGLGDNTVVLGNSSILTTVLRGNVIIGGTAVGTNAAEVLAFGNGTAPTAVLTDGVMVWAEDFAADESMLNFMSERSTNVVKIGDRIILPQVDEESTPTLAFADGTTGFYVRDDGSFRFSKNGTNILRADGTTFGVAAGSGGGFISETSTATNPSILPAAFTDVATGIGWAGTGALSLIASSVEGIRVLADRIRLASSVKTDTGDPSSPASGDVTINEFDNAIKIYADGAWRTLVSW